MGKGLEEREINLWDMFWAVCLKWRSVFACAIIFAILAGGGSCFWEYETLQDREIQQKVNSEDLYNELSDVERMFVDVYFDYMNKYEQIYLYNLNSPLMKIDANNFYAGEVSFYVDNMYKVQYPIIEQSNNVSAMVKAYKNVIRTEEFANQVSEIIEDCDPTYSMELIDDIGVYGQGKQEVEDKALFSIWVYANDEETCNQLLSLVRETIEDNKHNMVKEFGEHDLIYATDSIENISDMQLWQKQKSVLDNYQNCATHMKNVSTAFNEKQQEYVDKRIQELEEEKQGEQELILNTDKEFVGVNKKYVVLGFVTGAIIAFAFWIVEYLANSKIHLEDEFEKYFDCKLLGSIKLYDKEKKCFRLIDDFLVRCRYHNRRILEQKEAIEMVLANMRIATRKSGNKKIMVTGVLSEEKDKKIFEVLLSKAKNDGIEIIEGGSILYNSESLEKLVEIGQVVLIEQTDVSPFAGVMKEVELCHQHGVSLIGTILVY